VARRVRHWCASGGMVLGRCDEDWQVAGVGDGEQGEGAAPCAGSSWGGESAERGSEEALAMGKASERMRGRAGLWSMRRRCG
jgi:hypothetical protein